MIRAISPVSRYMSQCSKRYLAILPFKINIQAQSRIQYTNLWGSLPKSPFQQSRAATMPPRGGRKELSREVKVSKALSLILRHAAEKEGIKIDNQGYANVGELLLWRKLKDMKVTLDEALYAVSSSDKQRFGLLYIGSDPNQQPTSSQEDTSVPKETEKEQSTQSESATSTATAAALAANDPDPYHYLIRARQGHSIKTIDASSLLQELTLSESPPVPLPETVVHGTFHGAWPKILDSGGLRCMNRTHIHFASGPPLSSIMPDGPSGPVATSAFSKGRSAEGVISGMRGDAQILIYIDLKRALAAGCPFWISENGVILSEGMTVGGGQQHLVPTEFFDVVVETKEGLGVLWENGSLAKEPPKWMLAAKLPSGKAGRGSKGGKKGNKSVPRLQVEKETEAVGDV